MKLQMYSVRDNAVGAYLAPFFMRSRGEALRSFVSACQNAEHEFSKHPDDYRLYFLGEYDDNTGRCVCPEAPDFILSARDAVRSPESPGLPM